MPIHRRRSRADQETNGGWSPNGAGNAPAPTVGAGPSDAMDDAEAEKLLTAWRSLSTDDRVLLLSMAELMANQRRPVRD